MCSYIWTASPQGSNRHRRLAPGRGQAGFGLAEILIVVTIVGLIATLSVMAWRQAAARAQATATARVLKLYLHQARMKSIHQGVNHFVVVDPVSERLEIYEDTGTTVGSFDNDDPRVSVNPLGIGTTLGLPEGASTLTSPVDATTVSNGWAMPLPDQSARWGTTLRGVMLTPLGRISSAEAAPQPIGQGTLVFFDGNAGTVAVGIDGRAGVAFSFRLEDGSWRRI